MSPSRSARAALVLIVAAALAACKEETSATQSNAQQPKPAVQVGVVTLRSEPYTVTMSLPGRTQAFRVAEVRPQVAGILEKRLFKEGTEVEQGQQLYQIDPSIYKATLKSAEATLMSSRSLVNRYSVLVKERAVSRQSYDEARAAMLQAEATVEEARIRLRYTKVLAPISGRIGRSLETEGALVSAAQSTALAMIHQLDPMYVDVTQPAAQQLRLRRALDQGKLEQVGDNAVQVTLILEDGTEYEQAGTLEFSEVSVDEGTGSVTLRAIFPNPDRLLLPGMFVRARIAGGLQDQAILAPQQGISRNAQGQAVAMVANADDVVEQRIVEAQETVGTRWVVTQGLRDGDRLITEGLQYIQPGAKVKPSPATNVRAAGPDSAASAGKEG